MLPLQPRGLRAVTPGALNHSRRLRVGAEVGRTRESQWPSTGVMMPIDHTEIPGGGGFLPPLLWANMVGVLVVVGSKWVAGGAQRAGAIPPGRPDRAGVAARRERPG